jgi:glutathione S-transferase
MMTFKLHVFPPSPRAFKVMALAAYLSLDYELSVVDLSKGEHRSSAFAGLNPNQRMPVLEEGSFVLWESNAIMQYIAAKCPESRVLPADPQLRAKMNQWQCWELAHWDPAMAFIIYERGVKRMMNLGPPDLAEVAKGEERFHKLAPILDAQLGRNQFVVGDDVTVADFSLGSALNLSQLAEIPVQPYENIKRWYRQLTELPGWRKSMLVPPHNALP